MAGYLYQARYALLRGIDACIESPDQTIAIETLDDVTFEDSDNSVELLQSKHHTAPGNTSDQSEDLWKTLRNWVKYVASYPGESASTRFVLLTTQTAPGNCALAKLRPVDIGREPTVALSLLSDAARNSKNKATTASRRAFLALTPAARSLLVHRIHVLDQAPTITDVRTRIESALRFSASIRKVPVLADYLEGWWFVQVIKALTDPDQKPIRIGLIQDKIDELRDDFRLANLPLDDGIDAMPEITHLQPDDRVFIRQMSLVRVPRGEALIATHDYYKAFAQRSRWAREQLLLGDETDRYDRRLHDAWRRQFVRSATETTGADDQAKAEAGRIVFRWACAHRAQLRNRDEIWLSSGSLQMLAEALRLGWHSDYLERLGSGGAR